MTKIISKLPVSAEELQNFKHTALKQKISAFAAKLENDFAALCQEFTTRFNNNEWIYMGNKDVYYNNDIFGLLPDLANRYCDYNNGGNNYNTDLLKNLKFAGFKGDLPTLDEAIISFVNKTRYFRDSSYIQVCGTNRYGLTAKKDSRYAYYNTYRGGWDYHGNNIRGYNDSVWTIPIFRFGEEDTTGNAPFALFKWIEYDLTPSNFNSNETKKLFKELKDVHAKYKDYLTANEDKISIEQDKIFAAILAGTDFEFLPDAKKILAANTVSSSNDFLNDLTDELLNGDKIRADIDPYDKNILTDPNRGHWDLWDYGAGADSAGEITLTENLTARDPAEDINHGIVAIDFGTKSTVVVYENEHLQILPLQVGNGNYSKGVKAENYENPTVIQFINLKNFVEAYSARAGRPKTKWNDVTVSHTAFENLSGSDSQHYYSFLTGLKQWCGSKARMKITDRNKLTVELPSFMEVREDEINPLEYYAYYLGLYINNMLQEKRIFLKYIMSFPVTYEKSTREKMRRCFERGIKKSLPTALLSNEKAMKSFIVQDGASEPAAYAITALQEYNFDPEGDEENYYAVFDFGGGTTDFDFGVFKESALDRYDYDLVHFGENGDKTLGGENLLLLLAFEVFKANQETLLNPKKDDNSVGKIPFTFAADKKDFVGSAALINHSQEANLNMHNLAENLREVWENPDGETAKKIFDKGLVEVTLTTDKGVNLTNFPLSIEKVDLKKILRDRIEQGVENFFIAMREAFFEGVESSDDIKPLSEVQEVSIFLAGNSSKSKIVAEIFAEYLGQEKITESPFDAAGNLKSGYKLLDGWSLNESRENYSLVLAKTGGDFDINNSEHLALIGLKKFESPFDNEGNLKFGYKLKKGWDLQESRTEYLNFGGEFDINYENHLALIGLEKVDEIKNIPAEKIPVQSKAAKILCVDESEMPEFKIYPALGTAAALELQKKRGVEVNPNDIAAPTGKTGVAFGLLKCRDGGNVKITHITPTANQTPFQFYVGRNKKRKFKPVINKNTKFGVWYEFIDAGNNFDILYSDLPEAVSSTMDVQKAKRINVTLEKPDATAKVFLRAVSSNKIEYSIAKTVEELADAQNLPEPVPIELK